MPAPILPNLGVGGCQPSSPIRRFLTRAPASVLAKTIVLVVAICVADAARSQTLLIPETPGLPKGETSKEPPELTKPLEQATVHARAATEAMRQENWKKAAEQWAEVIKLQPDSAAAHANLGAVQLQLKKPDEARTNLEKAVALRPNLANTWMMLGMLYAETKNPMLAVSALTRAVHENPRDARIHNALAIVLKQIGWVVGAEQELLKAIDLEPDYAEAHFNLALLNLERTPPAIETARRHYQHARDLGTPMDELVEKQLRGDTEGGAPEKPAEPNKPDPKPGGPPPKATEAKPSPPKSTTPKPSARPAVPSGKPKR